TSSDLAVGRLKSNGVIKCHDHYLMEDITVPDSEQLSETYRHLKLFKRQNENLNMYFLLAPNAANIYKDKLPATVETADQDAYMDKFFRKMTKYGIIPIDVRSSFRHKKNSVQLYYRTDHHWTSEGAKLAYDTAHQKMDLTSSVKYKKYVVSNDFKGTLYSKSGFTNGRDDSISIYLPTSSGYKNSVIYYSDTKEKTTNFYKLDNLSKKDAYTVFGGSNHPFYTITTPVKSKRSLLIIKDSYANSMIPFFTQDFSKIVVVDPRYYFGKISDVISANGITDVLFLYNGNTLFSDTSLSMMLN
ncbi:MAG: DHHW family protein, partial [Anaerovoracaceae bacterium]